MTTTVYVVRHGMTVNARENKYNGHRDVSLSPEGERQMERLARHLKKGLLPNPLSGIGESKNAVDYVYCSDLSRSVKSAQILARPFGLEPIVVPGLRERSFGRWEGMTFDEIAHAYPEDFAAWAKDPLTFSPLGGENTKDVRDRVLTSLNAIIDQRKGNRIAVIGHGGINRIIICELLGIPLQNMFRIEQDFSALTMFMFFDELPVLKLLNYVGSNLYS